MHFNGFLYELNRLVPGLSGHSTAREIRRISAVTIRTLFNDNRVFHKQIILQTSLREGTFQRTERNFNPRFTSHRHCSGLHRMSKLAVTASHPYLLPAILFLVLKYSSYFHP